MMPPVPIFCGKNMKILLVYGEKLPNLEVILFPDGDYLCTYLYERIRNTED